MPNSEAFNRKQQHGSSHNACRFAYHDVMCIFPQSCLHFTTLRGKAVLMMRLYIAAGYSNKSLSMLVIIAEKNKYIKYT